MGGDSNACLQKFYLCGQTLERGHVHMITAINILTVGMVTNKTSFFSPPPGKKNTGIKGFHSDWLNVSHIYHLLILSD